MEITESLFRGRNMADEKNLLTVHECKKEIVNVMGKIINYAKKFNTEQEYILKDHRNQLEEYLTKNLKFIKSEEDKETVSYVYEDKKDFTLDIHVEDTKSDSISFYILLEMNEQVNKLIEGRFYNVNIDNMEGAEDIYGIKLCSSKNCSDDDIWHNETKEFDIKEWNRHVRMIQNVYDEDIQTRIDEGIMLYVDFIQCGNKKYKCDKRYKSLLEVFKDCVIDNK